jgi:hypothetical protein
MAARTGATAAARSWHRHLRSAAGRLAMTTDEVVRQIPRLAVSSADGWDRHAELDRAGATYLLALVMTASRHVRPEFGALLDGTELRRDFAGSCYQQARRYVEATIGGRRLDGALGVLDRASELLPGLGWDPSAAVDVLRSWRFPGADAVDLYLRGARSSEPVTERDELPAPIRGLVTSEHLSEGEVIDALMAREHDRRTALGPDTSEADDRVAEWATYAFDERLFGFVDAFGYSALRLLDGLSPAAAYLFVGHGPLDYAHPVSRDTLTKALANFKVLSRLAAVIARARPELLASPGTETDAARVVEIWNPQRKWESLRIDAEASEIAITDALLGAMGDHFRVRIDHHVRTIAERSGGRRALRDGYDVATSKLGYLAYALADFAGCGGFVAGCIDLPERPDRVPDHHVRPDWTPPGLVGVWIAVGDRRHGDDPIWRRVKTQVVFGCRPAAAAEATAGAVGRCGRGLQLYVADHGAKGRPGIAGACPSALAVSGFTGERWLVSIPGMTWDEVLEAMRHRAREVDVAMAALGLPELCGETLYRLRTSRALAVASRLPVGLEGVLDALLQHEDCVATFAYALLSLHEAFTSDIRRARLMLDPRGA